MCVYLPANQKGVDSTPLSALNAHFSDTYFSPTYLGRKSSKKSLLLYIDLQKRRQRFPKEPNFANSNLSINLRL